MALDNHEWDMIDNNFKKTIEELKQVNENICDQSNVLERIADALEIIAEKL